MGIFVWNFNGYLCIFRWLISLLMIVRIFVLYFVIIMKLEVWAICHCLELSNEIWYMLYAFLCSFGNSTKNILSIHWKIWFYLMLKFYEFLTFRIHMPFYDFTVNPLRHWNQWHMWLEWSFLNENMQIEIVSVYWRLCVEVSGSLVLSLQFHAPIPSWHIM